MIQILQANAGRSPGIYSLGPAEEERLVSLGLARRYSPTGYAGNISPDNFGTNAIDYPLSWRLFTGEKDASDTKRAVRLGIGGEVARALRPGNWVRIFFGLRSNGDGVTGTGPASGLFAPNSESFSVEAGSGTGYLVNGSHAVGATAIALKTGTGFIRAGDNVQFPNDWNVYKVAAGITAPGTITIEEPGLKFSKPNNTPCNPVPIRLDELRYLLDTCHAAGLKVLLQLDGPLSSDPVVMARWGAQLTNMFLALGQNNRQATFVDKLCPANEAYQLPGGGENVTVVAELQRITYVVTKALSPRTIVCSSSYQGGETLGSNMVLRLLAASAASTVSVLGDGGGAGTTGEMYIDEIDYHPYVENIQTVAQAEAALVSGLTANRLKQFLDPIRDAIATRRAANSGYWSGRADPKIIASEFNVSPFAAAATSKTAFRMQYFSPAERGHLLEQLVIAALACGVDCVIPYAPEHHYELGPIGPLVNSVAPNGDMRISSVNAGSIAMLDGDLAYISDLGGIGWTVVHNCNADGTVADLKGRLGVYGITPYQVTLFRYQLGGWAESFPGIQDRLMGYAEFSWNDPGDEASLAPQVRLDRSKLLRTVAGQLTTVATEV